MKSRKKERKKSSQRWKNLTSEKEKKCERIRVKSRMINKRDNGENLSVSVSPLAGMK